MSMGGGGSQMPMASNRGQQQLQQQMMMGQPMGGMQPQGMMPQQMPMPPSGGMFGGEPNGQMQQMQQLMQQAQQQQMMGGNSPYQMAQQFPSGNPMDGGMASTLDDFQRQQMIGRPEMSGIQGLMGNPSQVDMRPTAMANPNAGMPPNYRPTSGPIDGRMLRDMMQINRRRPMGGDQSGGLPGSIANDLPPSLKRPTQGDYRKFK